MDAALGREVQHAVGVERVPRPNFVEVEREPVGGRFVDSFMEIDNVAVPEPCCWLRSCVRCSCAAPREPSGRIETCERSHSKIRVLDIAAVDQAELDKVLLN